MKVFGVECAVRVNSCMYRLNRDLRVPAAGELVGKRLGRRAEYCIADEPASAAGKFWG